MVRVTKKMLEMKPRKEDIVREKLLDVFEPKSKKLHKSISGSYVKDFNHIDKFNRFVNFFWPTFGA